jgi:hypothetical protein
MGLRAGNQILSRKRRRMAARPITGNGDAGSGLPNDHDSNGIVAAVVAGRQALRIETSTVPKLRFPEVNADVDGPNSALVVNQLIQEGFPCAV